jgi:EpsI family protein
LIATVVLGGLAISTGPALAWWNMNHLRTVNEAELVPPQVLGPYRIGAVSQLWHPNYGTPAAKMEMGLTRPGTSAPSADVFVYYYASSKKGHTLIESTNKMWDERNWNAVSHDTVTAKIGNRRVTFNELVLSSNIQRRLVWSCYWTNGGFTTSATKVRLARLNDAFGRASGAALIAVSTPIENVTIDAARERLAAALSAMTDLPERLRKTGEPGNGPR